METKNELVKPEFKSEIKAEIKGIAEIEDNIQDVQNYALELNEYYSKIIFTEDTLKEAKTEKAEVNKFKSKVADFRKQITKKYNEPLQKFVDTAKMTESILNDTYETINKQVNSYEAEQLAIKTSEVKDYFEELCQQENIDFIDYSNANINVTLSASMKSLKEKANEFVNKILDDINLINSQQYIDEMMIEYKKDLNVSRAITEVQQRHVALEQAQKEKEEKREQEITDKEMIEKIDSLSAPKEEIKKELVKLAFEFIGEKEQAKIIVSALRNSKGQFRQLKEMGGYYE